MAHELGHAIHSMLASDHSLFTSQASLPLAETASTFGEMLLIDRLLAEETDESVRRDLLFLRLMMLMLLFYGRHFLPNSNGRLTIWSARAPRWTNYPAPIWKT
jgi:hypothetical protein